MLRRSNATLLTTVDFTTEDIKRSGKSLSAQRFRNPVTDFRVVQPEGFPS
jgi:hypothetical protein